MKQSKQVINLDELQTNISNNLAVLVYFNTTSCNVGEALEPKVEALLNTFFPKIKMYTIDLNLFPELSAAHNAFVEPTILVFLMEKKP